MRRRRDWAWTALVAAATLSCGGVSPFSGVESVFRVQGAQYVPGEISTQPGVEMPEVHTINSNNSNLYRGVVGKGISGTVGPGSAAIIIGMAGDKGHWVLPVSDADQLTLGDFIFGFKAEFSLGMAEKKATVIFRAADHKGNLGPPRAQELTLPPVVSTAAMTITLSWDTQSDLDLRAKVPPTNVAGDPLEIWSRKGNSLVRPAPGDPDLSQGDLDASAQLAFDSNAACLIDGQRQETISWPLPPPAGHYEIRVDAFSLCGEAAARWHVVVTNNGTVIQEARGQMGESDTRFNHGNGAGLLVAVFDL